MGWTISELRYITADNRDTGVSSTVATLTGVVRELVKFPDKVAFEIRPEPEFTTLILQVYGDDYDLVMGQEGRTAKSLRTIVLALAAKWGTRLRLDIVKKTV